MSSRPTTASMGWLICAACLVFAPACDEPKPPPAPADSTAGAQEATASAASAAKVRPDKLRGRHGAKRRAAFKGLLAMALKQLDLTDEQRNKIQELRAADKPSKTVSAPRKAFDKALAEAVRSGTVDEASLADEIAAVDKQRSDQRAERVKALQQLHGLLSPEQRKALAGSLAERKATRWVERLFAAPGDKVAGELGDRRRNMRSGPGRLARKTGGRDIDFSRMLRRLRLTPEQREKVTAARKEIASEAPKKEEREARATALKEAREMFVKDFIGDAFDAEALAAKIPRGKDQGARLSQLVKTVKAVLPILTEEQRDKLAGQILEPPRMRPGARFRPR